MLMVAGQADLAVFWLLLVAVQALALAVDALCGEPRRWHPLVGFGALVACCEVRYNGGRHPRLAGTLVWLGLVGIPVIILAALLSWLWQWNGWAFWAVNLGVLYFALGLRSLAEHADRVAAPLRRGDLAAARTAVGWLVSRDTRALDATQVSKACVESVLENGNDAVFAALFWFALAGAPGALAWRLANTLDACWGYRSPRLRQFGWAAARADDLLAYLPARICAFCYALAGASGPAFAAWRRMAQWRRAPEAAPASPNAGIVMATGAGALRVRLGGPAFYAGERVFKVPLGLDTAAEADVGTIGRSIRLLRRAVGIWLAVQFFLGAGLYGVLR